MVGRSPFGFVRSLEVAAADNSPHIEVLWEIILHIQEKLVMHDGRVTPLGSLKIWQNRYDGFAAHAYSWLCLHHESNTSEAAIAGISHTRPRIREQITESLATHERVNRPSRQEKGEVDQAFPDTIKSEADFWSQEAITKSLNNTTPSASEIADIPRTRQEHARYIREMFDALKNTEGIIEKPTNTKVEVVKSTSGRVLLDIAWVLLREAKTFQLGRPNVKPWCTSFVSKKYPTMRARWHDMVSFFNTSKAAVANLIVAHNEKRFAGNPEGEKSRKVQNDKTNKGKATSIQTYKAKATTLDEMVNQARGRERARRSAASSHQLESFFLAAPAPNNPSAVTQSSTQETQNGGPVDQNMYRAEAGDVLDGGKRVTRREADVEEPEDDDEDFADIRIDEGANEDEDQPLERTTGRVGTHNGDEHNQKNLDIQVEQGSVDPSPILGVHAGSSQAPSSAYYPHFNGLTGPQHPVHIAARNEGHCFGITPRGESSIYPSESTNGFIAPTLHPNYAQYSVSNSSNDLAPMPYQSMGYPAQCSSGNTFMGDAQVAGRDSTAVGIGLIHPALLNSGISNAGGGSQSSATSNRRGRDSFEDDIEADVDAHPRKRYRF